MKTVSIALMMVLITSIANAQNLFAAKKKNKWGFIDVNGNWVIPPEYYNASAFSEGFASVEKFELRSYVDTRGKLITGFQFFKAFPFQNGICSCKLADEQ